VARGGPGGGARRSGRWREAGRDPAPDASRISGVTAVPHLRYVLPSLLPFLLLPAAAALAGGIPPTARHAGPEGVRDRAGHRFTAVPLATRTVLTKSETEGGRVLRASILRGRWGVPVVAEDSTSGGLSADRRTLVLTRVPEAFPRRRTAFALVDTASLALRDTVHLQGDWRFDALSPHGRRLYLIEQLGRFGSPRTAARTYDLERDRLLPTEEPLAGYPISRAKGRTGSWVYTLYAGTPRPFVHALDTARNASRRIDLPGRVARHRRLFALRLDVRRNRVAVLHGDRIVASAARRPRRASAGGGPPWLAVAVALTGLVLAATATRRAQAASRRSRELR
jgi:hypothetical protein